ncbi:unnamed protein product [Phaeothamnion confervicola]
MAVELAVALLHHPRRHHSPADTRSRGDGRGCGGAEATGRLDDPDRPLGLLPHQIRGFMAHFSQLLTATQAFDCCTACSPAVVRRYR